MRQSRRSILKTLIAAPLALLGIRQAKAEKPELVSVEITEDLGGGMYAGRTGPTIKNARCVLIDLPRGITLKEGFVFGDAFGYPGPAVEKGFGPENRPPDGVIVCTFMGDVTPYLVSDTHEVRAAECRRYLSVDEMRHVRDVRRLAKQMIECAAAQMQEYVDQLGRGMVWIDGVPCRFYDSLSDL